MSRSKLRRRLVATTLVLASATSFQFLSGCGNYFLEIGLASFDVCSVLNCTGSSFFDFCGSNSILIDCPDTNTTTP